MKDVIDILLQKQRTLEADRDAEKALACEKIDAEYDDRARKIEGLLVMAGYVPESEEAPGAAADATANAVDTAEATQNAVQSNAMNVY